MSEQRNTSYHLPDAELTYDKEAEEAIVKEMRDRLDALIVFCDYMGRTQVEAELRLIRSKL